MMIDLLVSLLPLIGFGLVVLGNALRARRTDNISCMGHLFVAAERMTVLELILNRVGIAVFVVSTVANLVY